jgi:hypothetical protein
LTTAVAATLVVASCAHLPRSLLSDAEATQLAEDYAARREIDVTGREIWVERFDTGTSVFFGLPGCRSGCIDGDPMLFFIPAGKRRITHFQDGRP